MRSARSEQSEKNLTCPTVFWLDLRDQFAAWIAARNVRLRHLLGLRDGWPTCWLYQSVNGQLVARRENAGLQVCAATPAAAIAGLRLCATTCPHVVGNALAYSASRTGICVHPDGQSRRQLYIDCAKAGRGFWGEAGRTRPDCRAIPSRAHRSRPDTSDIHPRWTGKLLNPAAQVVTSLPEK